MNKSKLYTNTVTGKVITSEEHYSTMMLIKILFKLNIINVEQAMELASKFEIFLYN
jgi:hypothetical protein